MKNLISWLAIIALVVAAIFSVPRMLRLTLGTEEPMLTVISGSMWPSLSRGDLVFVKETSLVELKKGTVIVFRHSGGMAVHRIVDITDGVITTKGDANTSKDDPMTFDNVVGRVPEVAGRLAKIPWVGNIALTINPQNGESVPPAGIAGILRSYVTSPLGFVLIVILPLLLLFIGYMEKIIIALLPGSTRQQRQRVVRQRLMRRWSESRVKRAFRDQ